ncbi:MAG: class I SAM-dependent methyltransferase [Bacteroidota bacterium]
MRLQRCAARVIVAALVTILSTPILAAGPGVFDIPRIEGIVVDGSGDEWGDSGFTVGFVTDPEGRALPAEDFDLKFRVGWSAQGLFVLATVRDDIPLEHENLNRIWQRDCVELFLAETVGSGNRHQLVIASGADPRYGELRSRLYDHRPEAEKVGELSSRSASRIVEGGYVVEAWLPWENLGRKPEAGGTVAFQCIANDFDGDDDPSGGPLRVGWYPGLESHASSREMYSLRLAEAPGEPILFRVERKIGFGYCNLSIRGSDELIGVPVEVRNEEEVFGSGRLTLKEGRAGVQYDLVPGFDAGLWPQLQVAVGEKIATTYESLPSLDRIVENYLAAVGGREAIAKLTTRFASGNLINELSWKEPSREVLPFEAYAQVPDRWVVAFGSARNVHSEGFDGINGWRQTPDRIETVRQPDWSRLGWLLNPQGPLQMREYYHGLVLQEKTKLDGRDAYLVDPTMMESPGNELYFDAETGMLLQIGPYWRLEEYRDLDGVKFPFRIVMSRKGGSSTLAFDEVEHNVSVDEAQFSEPDPGVVFADAFEDIQDPAVLPMLEYLPFVHGGMNVPIRDGRFLYDLITEHDYTRGLEIGTSNGYSALWLGLAFRETGGKLVTIEIDSLSGLEARWNFKRAGLDEVVDCRINDAFEEISRIEGEFDFVFIDALKPDYVKFLRLLRDRMEPGGTIAAHNVTSQVRDMGEFLDAIRNDPGLETTFHTPSSEGISLSVVRE